MSLKNLLENLKNGQSTVYSVGTAQKYTIAKERVDGKETGFTFVKNAGGRVNRKVAENILLQGVQALSVRKGITDFGNDAVLLFAQNTPESLLEMLILKGIEPRFVSAIVSRFLKSIEVTVILSDVQNLEVIQAVCISEIDCAAAVKRATSEEYDAAVLKSDKQNGDLRAALAALKKDAAAAAGGGLA